MFYLIPSSTSIKCLLYNFRGVKAGLKALAEERYDDVIQCCNEQLAMEAASGEAQSEEYYEALLLRASMMILRSEMEAAIKEFTDIINAKPTNIKVGIL
jgi:accessory colonization factor AcfC